VAARDEAGDEGTSAPPPPDGSVLPVEDQMLATAFIYIGTNMYLQISHQIMILSITCTFPNNTLLSVQTIHRSNVLMAVRRDTLSDLDFFGSTFNIRGSAVNIVHSNIFNNLGGDQYNIVQLENYPIEQELILAQLRPVDRSDFYVSPCMPGTRRSVVDAIFKWLDDTEAPNILWLSGSPGVGKSAVASTVSELVTTRLVSSFFCRQNHTVLCDPAAIWRSVAYDFAQLDSVFAWRLIQNMKAGVDPTRPDVMLHFERLIKEPLMESWKKSGKSDVPGMSARIWN
jgi:hypothetical protein